jgi:deoxyribonuclease IV
LLGSNVSTVGGLQRAFEQAVEWDCECIQVYTTPSRRWEVPDLDPERRDEYFANWKGSPVREVIAHIPFLVNTASADRDAWARSQKRLEEEVARAGELGIHAVVLHPGSAGQSPHLEALQRSAEAIRAAVTATAGSSVQILIENMAGQGSMLCSRFEEVSQLLELIERPERTGVCFDTAHAFIAGYPLVGYDGYGEVLTEFDRIVGIEQVKVFHVNDSLSSHGSRHDRHAAVGKGEMGLEPFHALMRDPRFADVPMLLEVPDRDDQSLPALELLRELEKREAPLEPAPHRSVQLSLSASKGGSPDRKASA